MKIFITGASGFIGGAIVSRLCQDHEFRAMARSESSAKKVESLGAIAVQSSLGNVKKEDLEGCEVMIHCAAFVEPWGTRKQFWEGNVEGTRQILEVAKAAGIKRFINIGTEALLFRGQDMVDIDESYPYPDKTPFLYSETKREAEKLVLAANQEGVFETLSVRPRLVWGPGDTTIQANLNEMVDSGAFRWINKGKAETSSCHVYNLVEGVRLALTEGRGGEAYFITDDEIHSFHEFINLLLATTGRIPSKKNLNPGLAKFAARLIEGTWRTFGIKSKPPVTRFAVAIMTAHCTIDITKAKEELGYVPVISVKEGMAEMTKGA